MVVPPVGDRQTMVYIAQDADTGRYVSLRVFPWPAPRPAAAEVLFRKEMAAVGALDYPHIVPLDAFGTGAGFLWCATRFVERRSLDIVLRDQGPLGLARCLRIVEQVASALHYAHRRGVVHGDVQPATVWLEGEHWALVGDFGLARILRAVYEDASAAQYAGRPDDLRSAHPAQDQLRLAAIVCVCLAGTQTSTASVTAAPSPDSLRRRLFESRPDLPRHVTSAVERAMAADASERFRTVLDFVAALSAAGVGAFSAPALPLRPRNGDRQRVLPVTNARRRARRWVAVPVATLAGLSAVALAAAWPSPDRAPLGPMVAPLPLPISERPAPTVSDAEVFATPAGTPPALEEPAELIVAAPPTAPPARTAPAPGRLFINSRPWGHLFVDGRSVGNTPRSALEVAPGEHHVRVVREGFQTFNGVLVVASGLDVRLTDIVLERVVR
jgi:serine/threonine-protein kinase